ncbi:N-formylglutamate amidohydrolase [Sphingobium olei]
MKKDMVDHPAPQMPMVGEPAFDLYGAMTPRCPVIFSVPHAGRDYSEALLASARVDLATLRRLEDRWVDLITHPLIERGCNVLVARTARALIDLNRNEREIDPAMIADMPRGAAVQSSAKLRGGLGLFPRRLPGVAELWRQPMDWDDARARIEQIHRPYHAAIRQSLLAARDAHGQAILIDLHSMPPIPSSAAGQRSATMIFGDRFGRSASSRLIALAADVAQAHGLRVAHNHPYAGDHVIERHGRPEQRVHAIQIEIDRTLYLDSSLDEPGAGLPLVQKVIADITDALADELRRSTYALAAE